VNKNKEDIQSFTENKIGAKQDRGINLFHELIHGKTLLTYSSHFFPTNNF
jgi:hypothetical protein